MILIRILARWAATLGVETPGEPSSWLIRFFLLPRAAPPPRSLAAFEEEIAASLHALLMHAARLLDLPTPPRARDLLWRLFVRPDGYARIDALVRLEATRDTLAKTSAKWMRARSWMQAKLGICDRGFQRGCDRAQLHMEVWASVARLSGKPRLVRTVLWVVALLTLVLVVTTPLDGAGQALLAAAAWGATLLVRKIPGRLATLVMISLSTLISLRYGWWRFTETLDLQSAIDYVAGVALITAEGYTVTLMLLGYFQTSFPLQRKPAPLPNELSEWPTVDIYIPSYNEPLSVVRPTVLAAKGIDWPIDKLQIYILDDGRREEFRLFADEIGIGYITREDNVNAKAGNLNHALRQTHGEYIAIFDCDHLPTRSFLQSTMGHFFRDPRCALVQTPHHFFSPDPMERNLGIFRRVPNESALFHGLIQDGNDMWNASFFCGSCAVLKRGPLEEVGGVAVETVTEDAHTALKLHRRGYTSAYLNVPQAAGLATESLSAHIGQRVRWARGMAQIFRLENPLFNKELSLFQRLCYANASLHFFHGIPWLIFLTVPLAYLFFNIHSMNTTAGTVALYALPHLALASLTNSRTQGNFRHSYWATIYEAILAWYTVIPTTLALLNPRLGRFNVTTKGGLIQKAYFDWAIAKPYVALFAISVAALLVGLVRLLWWGGEGNDTVLLNLLWTLFNLVTLGAAIGVAAERRQLRRSQRVPADLPAMLYLEDGRSFRCRVTDFSTTSIGVDLPMTIPVQAGDASWIVLNRGDREFAFRARLTARGEKQAGMVFEQLTLEEEESLMQCTFGRADAWCHWDKEQLPDRPIASLKEVIRFGYRGVLVMQRHAADALLHLVKKMPSAPLLRNRESV